MKQILFIPFLLMIVISINSQSPDKFRYQAVIRNSDGTIRANQSVNLQIEILRDSVNGSSTYIETHSVTTTNMGLANLVIGDGTVVSGQLDSIDWAYGPFFLKIWQDGAEMGTSQLMSVPFAKYADRAGNGFSGNYPDLNNKPEKTGYFEGDMQNKKLSHLSNPEEDQDAVTKAYLIDALNASGLMSYHFNGFVMDIDGNRYPTLKIGSQTWMGKNLQAKHYSNGDPVAYIQTPSNWASLATGGYCYLNNDTGFNAIYGKLYNFSVVIDARNICPTGWHVPDVEDWLALINPLGGQAFAGGKLKEANFSHWLCCDGGSNTSGFTALPGGFCDSTGVFPSLGSQGLFWTSTSVNSTDSYYCNLYAYQQNIKVAKTSKQGGFSLRCIKN